MNAFRTGKTGWLIKWRPLRFEKRLGIVHTRVNRLTAPMEQMHQREFIGLVHRSPNGTCFTRLYKMSFYRAGFVENAVVDVVYEGEVVGGMPVEAVTVDVEGNSLDQLVDGGHDLKGGEDFNSPVLDGCLPVGMFHRFCIR